MTLKDELRNVQIFSRSVSIDLKTYRKRLIEELGDSEPTKKVLHVFDCRMI